VSEEREWERERSGERKREWGERKLYLKVLSLSSQSGSSPFTRFIVIPSDKQKHGLSGG
jgi:hypothetical protein